MQKTLRTFIFLLLVFIHASCSDQESNVTLQVFPEFVNGVLSHQGRERQFVLHIPTSYDGTAKTPLIIFLHGGLGNTQSAQGFTNFNRISDENGFLVAYPQGAYEASQNSFVWADGRGLPADNEGIDDVGFINELVDHFKKEYRINEKKIYLCGFSNGSFLTQKIAFKGNHKFAAMGTLGGTMHKDFFDNGNPERAIPMIYVFGDQDPLVPYNGGFVSDNPELAPVVGVEDAVAYWVNNNQCQTELPPIDLPNINQNDNSTVTVFEYINGDCNDAKVKFYRINGGGHT